MIKFFIYNDINAFEFCTGLSNITIATGVTSIGHDAFYNCSSLTSIQIPNSISSIGQSAFNGCSKVESIIMPISISTRSNFTILNDYKIVKAVENNTENKKAV